LVLLDIGLPDASGISLASALTGLRPAPDIIAITSERDLEMVRAAVAHGALAYLLKPFTFAAFQDRLERYRRSGWRCPQASMRPARRRSIARCPNCVLQATSPSRPRAPHHRPTTTSPGWYATTPTV